MRVVSATLLLMISSGLSVAQGVKTDDLVMTATVISVKPIERAVGAGPDKRKDVIYAVDLLFQVRNGSTTPLIILKPDSYLGKTLTFLHHINATQRDGTFTTKSDIWIEPKYTDSFLRRIYPDRDYLAQMLSSFQQPEPRGRDIVVIDAGAYHEFRDKFEIKNGYDSSVIEQSDELLTERERRELQWTPKEWRIKERSLTKCEFPALRVEYHVSGNSHANFENLPKKLQERWRKFGHLPLDSNGDYRLVSQPIINICP